jgi:hypothetical protein
MTLLVLGLLYFLPAILAHHKRNQSAIFVVNLLTGWTVIGWMIALVWALTDEPAFMPVYAVPQSYGVSRLCAQCGKYSVRDASYCSICGSAFR